MNEREASETPADRPSTGPAADRVWTLDDIAAYLQCAVRTVQEIRREDETFPEPRYVRSMPRWLPAEVQAWFANLGQTPAGTSAAYRRADEQRAVVAKPAVRPVVGPKAVVPKRAPARVRTDRRESTR